MIPIDWAPCVNVSGSAIPSFGVAIVTGVDADGNFELDAPDADNDAGVIVLGAGAMPDGGYGQGTFDNRVWILYDERDGTPAAGDEWGVKTGEHRLRSGYTGFRILGGASGGLVNAVRVATTTGGGGGSIEVEDTDESPTVASVTQLRFDSADGFVVSTPGAGIARVDMQAATNTQAGIVSLANQVMGDGSKRFFGVLTGTTLYASTVADGQVQAAHQVSSAYAVTAPASALASWAGVVASGAAITTPTLPTVEAAHRAAESMSIAARSFVVTTSTGGLGSFSILSMGDPAVNYGADAWLIPGGTNSGRIIGAGRFAYYYPSDGKVYTGVTGTVGIAPTVHGGVVTSTGVAAPAADRIVFYDLSAAGHAYLAPDGTGIEINATTLRLKNQGSVPDLTNSTGGMPGIVGAIGDVGASFSQSAINDNFSYLTEKINQLLDKLQAAGIVGT